MRVLAAQLQPLAGTHAKRRRTSRPASSRSWSSSIWTPTAPLSPSSSAAAVPEQAQWSELERRNHLGRFGFRGDRVFEPTRQFSGGERARLALAILVARKPNLLLLDEPTNHLDLDMRHALLVALQDFAGAVVIVSHDRALLRGACDRFLLVANGAVTPFDGDLEDYAAWLARGSDTPQADALRRPPPARPGGSSAASKPKPATV